MNPSAAVHDALAEDGWAIVTEQALGLDGAGFRDAFGPALKPDPRGEGKQHARDVIAYNRPRALIWPWHSMAHVTEAGQVVDDFSRLHLLGRSEGYLIADRMLRLIPPESRLDQGLISAGYWRYGAGVEVGAHRDGFGDFVIIWVLSRSGGGGESFLTRGGGDAFRGVLEPGAILIFRDELFEHGFTLLGGPGAQRDALIFVTLKGQPA